MAIATDTPSIDELNAMAPEALLRWARDAHGERAGIITSFQDTGSVMVDMMHRHAPGLRVLTVDTLRLHDETYALMDAVERKYGIAIERYQPDPYRLERRDQSAFRADTPKAQYVQRSGREILKIAPLADWDQEQIDAYIAAHAVPKSQLYEQGYTSIGCVICTTPTLPHEDKRAGRWRWFNANEDSKECGIHIGGSGI